MEQIYNDVLVYIANEFQFIDNKYISHVIRKMDLEHCPLSHADTDNTIIDAIYSGIQEFELDKDYDEDEILNEILDNIDIEDVFFDTIDYMDNKSINEAFYNKNKINPYDDKKDKSNYSSQPLKDNISLYDIRQRVQEIVMNCNSEDVEIAKKQASRLYKLIDAMINQGYRI